MAEISEKAARKMCKAMGKPVDKWNLKRLTAKLNDPAALAEGVETTLEGDDLATFKAISKAYENGEAVTISGAKATAKPATKNPGKARDEVKGKKGGKEKAAKKASPSGPSNKELVYRAWEKSKDKSPSKADEYHKKVGGAVKVQTIRSWISGWNHGKMLPACAKK